MFKTILIASLMLSTAVFAATDKKSMPLIPGPVPTAPSAPTSTKPTFPICVEGMDEIAGVMSSLKEHGFKYIEIDIDENGVAHNTVGNPAEGMVLHFDLTIGPNGPAKLCMLSRGKYVALSSPDIQLPGSNAKKPDATKPDATKPDATPKKDDSENTDTPDAPKVPDFTSPKSDDQPKDNQE